MIRSSPYILQKTTLQQIMLKVIYALIPGILVYIYFFGWAIISNLLLAIGVALITESIALLLRKRPLKPYLSDGSAILTSILLTLAIPSIAPWWMIVIGVSFSILIAKHVYGGLGYNPFNPAMVGYIILLVSFPLEMTHWVTPINMIEHTDKLLLNITQTLQYQFFNLLPTHTNIDAITMATPLDELKTALNSSAKTVSEIKDEGMVYGYIGGIAWEWLNIAYLIGGLWLIQQRIISWHIPIGFLSALFLMALFFGTDIDQSASPLFHLFSGATMLGAFFIATDPITAATTPKGRIIFGAGIGILVYIIRTWGGYPDGVAFAVLLMNMLVPLLDYYTQPKVFGHDSSPKE